MKPSELILNPDGSVYHLNLLPDDVATTIILVGDPGRVGMVSKYFDEIEVRKSKREFITETGRIGTQRISVISTGIGTDNVDIVLNEVDALFNVDLETRKPKEKITQLDLIRIGTSGALRVGIPLDAVVVSEYGLGLDAMARMGEAFHDQRSEAWYDALVMEMKTRELQLLPAYMAAASPSLCEKFSGLGEKYVTVTCAGFYGLQGRSIRLRGSEDLLISALRDFEYGDLRVGNLEMETAGLYLLAHMLGHRAISLNAIVANRESGTFSAQPYEAVDALIRDTLTILTRP